ncbi:MAG TPA: ATP-grasp domain-containing protein [Gaiellaceae bacterium]|nr:ATP-grasp domain-containing protein [Gaiellaceae bacterium]
MSLYVAGRLTPTNVALVDAFRAFDHPVFLAPLEQVARRARRGDTVLPRLDVLPTLDGVEPGLDRLGELQRRGVLLVNGPGAILAAHDKLMTALKLGRSGVPHPRTIHVDAAPERLPIRLPVVVKPRFGSWGQDVVLCRTEDELRARLGELRSRPWFVRQGALVQELVPPRGYDLRVLVADGEVVGAVQRVAAAGEWRTNIALGGHRVPATPPRAARELALRAAAAIGGGFVGIDLLPTDAGFSVIEVNGCVDFTAEYGLGGDVHAAVAGRIRALALAHEERAADAPPAPVPARRRRAPRVAATAPSVAEAPALGAS